MVNRRSPGSSREEFAAGSLDFPANCACKLTANAREYRNISRARDQSISIASPATPTRIVSRIRPMKFQRADCFRPRSFPRFLVRTVLFSRTLFYVSRAFVCALPPLSASLPTPFFTLSIEQCVSVSQSSGVTYVATSALHANPGRPYSTAMFPRLQGVLSMHVRAVCNCPMQPRHTPFVYLGN